MKQRVADFLTDSLYRAGAENIFMVSGGVIMHLTDALLQHKSQTYTCCHHEQSAVMAAEAYGRFTGALGAAYVTAGPGALNTLNGVVGALVDTSPCIVVAGQSKLSLAKQTGPRQFAIQGFNTLPIFSLVTKYATMLDDVATVRYEVEKAIYTAKVHRVGPVWIEVPIDIQAEKFDPDEYEGYMPSATNVVPQCSLDLVRKVAELLSNSRRPCILAGAGVRLSGAIDNLRTLAERWHLPILTSRLGLDVIEHDHPLFVGRPGTYGDRAANFTIQNCDLLLVLGCRLGVGLIGYNFQDFARHARKIVVDVDESELAKPSVVPDMPILADANDFLEKLLRVPAPDTMDNACWIERTQGWKHTYPVDLPEYLDETDGINSYHFITEFSRRLPEDAVVVLDTGSCFYVYGQAFQAKRGQRHIITGGLSTMGYWPGAIGVAQANHGKPVYCVTGDGSFQFNIQELQTMVHNRLPIKTIVFNNEGYLLIRLTQQAFQGGRLIGSSKESGVSFPDLSKIAAAYGIKFMRITSLSELSAGLDEFLACDSSIICEVITPKNQAIMPKIGARENPDGSIESTSYDDMVPFLPRDEYEPNANFWRNHT